MDQRNETFLPHVLAIDAGTVVDFPNNDTTYHNVFSLSKTRKFDLGRYARGKSKSIRFERPGIVRVFCDIHSHMSAFVLVFSHPYYAKAEADGRYRIDNVPPGTYTVSAWHEGETRETQDGHRARRRAATWIWTSSSNDARRLVADEPHLPGLDAAGGAGARVRASISSTPASPRRPRPSCAAASNEAATLVDRRQQDLIEYVHRAWRGSSPNCRS